MSRKSIHLPFGRSHPVRHLAIVAALGLSVVACGGGGDEAEASTIDAAEWVEEFDRVCVETATRLSDPALSDTEFEEINREALAGIRALPQPDTMSEEAAVMLDVIEATNVGPELDQETIDKLEDDFLDAAGKLGVSAACVYGASD